MGYYTFFQIEIIAGVNNPPHSITEMIENLKDFRPFLKEVFDEEGNWEDTAKWYDCEEDMRKFSKMYPSYLFILHGEGEDRTDNWRVYAKNGKSEYVCGEIVYARPDWANLI